MKARIDSRLVVLVLLAIVRPEKWQSVAFQIATPYSFTTGTGKRRCVFGRRRSTCFLAQFTFVSRSTALAAVKNEDLDVDAQQAEQRDFPNWVKALARWPLGSRQKEAVDNDPTVAPQAPPLKSNDDKWDVDVDFLNNLQQWPFSSSDDTDNAQKIDTVASSSFLSPLTRLINLETLLSGSAEARADQQQFQEEREDSVLDVITSFLFANDDNANDGSTTIDVAKSAPTDSNATVDDVRWQQRLEEISNWDSWMGGLRSGVSALTVSGDFAKSAEGVLRQATSRIEGFVAGASRTLSPESIQNLVAKATKVMQNTTELVESAKQMALANGLDVREAAERAIETSEYAASLAQVVDGVVRQGYVDGDPLSNQTLLANVSQVEGSRPLFADFASAKEIDTYNAVLAKGAEMGDLAGAIYEDTVPRTLALGHTIVAQGVTQNVMWMVTDSVANRSSFYHHDKQNRTEPPIIMVRTITLRGFDASDDNVDREELLNQVCIATPERIGKGLLAHTGLLNIARAIYDDVGQYIEWTSPDHKLVLNGHSVGGSLSILLLVLTTLDKGADFVGQTFLRVYTFGSPPVLSLRTPPSEVAPCNILKKLGLPADLVHAYVQPWDPIVRLFSEKDALYPLVGDIGADGVTPWESGPPRTLRPITKAIVESWDGWPRFRDNFKETALQNFTGIGTQHILLPEPTRYLADRFFSVYIPVPPVETVVQLSASELLPALSMAFPLDVFEVSFVPQAIRSFVHHFYPAYGLPIVEYVSTLERRAQGKPVKDRKQVPERVMVEEGQEVEKILESNGVNVLQGGLESASQWLKQTREQ